MNKVRFFSFVSMHWSLLLCVVVIFAGIAIIGFLDENSLLVHWRNTRKIKSLHTEIIQYREQYESDSKTIWLLDNDLKTLRKIARELYFMKYNNEDIFVFSDEIPVSQFSKNEETQ